MGLTLLAAALCLAAPPLKVAVLPVQLDGVARQQVPGIVDEYVSSAVHDLKLFDVISQDDVNAMLGFERHKDLIACDDASCLADIGGALGADRILATRVSRVGDNWLVSIKLINIREAKTEARTTETLKGDVMALFGALPNLVARLFGVDDGAARATGPRATRCEVILPASGCPAQPELTGSFDDDYQGAGSSQERCLERAAGFYNWCGAREPITARYWIGGKAVAEQIHAPPSRCEIRLAAGCPAHTEHGQLFNDTWEGSDASQGRCLARAEEFFQWCAGGGSVGARFFRAGQLVAETTHAPATRCEIRLPAEGCPAHPSMGRWFNDDWQGAGTSQERCLQRAAEFFGWCAAAGGVTATFHHGERALASHVHAPTTRCLIEMSAPACPSHPEVGTRFNDDWQGAGSSQAKCLARAGEFFSYCARGEPVTARFFRGTEQLATTTHAPTSRCEIELPPEGCPKHPGPEGRFNDSWDGAGDTAARCLRRANEFRDWCGTRGSVGAVFFAHGREVGRTRSAPR